MAGKEVQPGWGDSALASFIEEVDYYFLKTAIPIVIFDDKDNLSG
jgi:hypothetical protein